MEHTKPIIILNIDNQWDDLLKILEPLKLNHLYHVVDSPRKAMKYIEEKMKVLIDDEYDG